MILENLLRTGQHVEGTKGQPGYACYSYQIVRDSETQILGVLFNVETNNINSNEHIINMNALSKEIHAITTLYTFERDNIGAPITLYFTGLMALRTHFSQDRNMDNFFTTAGIASSSPVTTVAGSPSSTDGPLVPERLAQPYDPTITPNFDELLDQIAGIEIGATLESKKEIIDRLAFLISHEQDDARKNILKHRCLLKIVEIFKSMNNLTEMVNLFDHLLLKKTDIDHHTYPRWDKCRGVWNTDTWRASVHDIRAYALAKLQAQVNAYIPGRDYAGAEKFLQPFEKAKLFVLPSGNFIKYLWAPEAADYIEKKLIQLDHLKSGTSPVVYPTPYERR